MDISNWVVFSSLVTALGVLVALGIAIAGARERGQERKALQEAEARLIRIHAVGRTDNSEPYTGPPEFRWTVSNLGPHGVFDVMCEAWMWTGERWYDVNKPDWTQHEETVGASKVVIVSTEFGGGVAASLGNHYLTWRVRWSDRYGNRWVVNGRDRLQDPPHRYRNGEGPPQHHGPGSGL